MGVPYSEKRLLIGEPDNDYVTMLAAIVEEANKMNKEE